MEGKKIQLEMNLILIFYVGFGFDNAILPNMQCTGCAFKKN